MFRTLFRSLVPAVTVGLVVVGSTMSFADLDKEFSPKEVRRVEKLVNQQVKPSVANLKADARAVRKQLRDIRKRVQKGELAGEELEAELKEACEALERVREADTTPDFEDVGLDQDALFALRTARFVSALVLTERNEGDPTPHQIHTHIPSGTVDRIIIRLEDVRLELAAELDREKRRIGDTSGGDDDAPASFVFRRNFETHFVQPLEEEDPVAFVRPGLQRVEVTEEGSTTIEVAVAENEPDSFVLIDLKRPDGTVITRFTARQRDSVNGDSRRLRFNFPLDALPAPGEIVLFTTTSGTDESLLPLLDPFDCLAFAFPGLSTPTTGLPR